MKKLLILVLTLCVSYTYGMQNKEKIGLEDRLLVGIRDNNLASVKAAIEAGAPVNEIAYLIGYKGEQPLRTAYAKGRLEIAEYLLSRGANKAILNDFLEGSARGAEVEKIKWLLAHGAQDADGQALYYAKEYEEDEYRPTEKAKYKEIIRLLEQAKRKSLWKPKPALPSKGIFKELETEEFLETPSSGAAARRTVAVGSSLVSRPLPSKPVGMTPEQKAAAIAKIEKEKAQQAAIERAQKQSEQRQTYVSDAAVLIGIAGGQPKSYEQRNSENEQIQQAMPQEAPQEERARVYAR